MSTEGFWEGMHSSMLLSTTESLLLEYSPEGDATDNITNEFGSEDDGFPLFLADGENVESLLFLGDCVKQEQPKPPVALAQPLHDLDSVFMNGPAPSTPPVYSAPSTPSVYSAPPTPITFPEPETPAQFESNAGPSRRGRRTTREKPEKKVKKWQMEDTSDKTVLNAQAAKANRERKKKEFDDMKTERDSLMKENQILKQSMGELEEQLSQERRKSQVLTNELLNVKTKLVGVMNGIGDVVNFENPDPLEPSSGGFDFGNNNQGLVAFLQGDDEQQGL